MPRFQFRLDTSLRLAERFKEEAQRVLALEIKKWQTYIEKRDQQRSLWEEALEGQKQAGLNSVQDLGSWQAYAARQFINLRRMEEELSAQQEIVEDKRRILIEAQRELEKFKRLKEKQHKAFLLRELRKEQAVIDEAAQVVFWRQNAVG